MISRSFAQVLAFAHQETHLRAAKQEMDAQDAKWGQQDHPDGTSEELWGVARDLQRDLTDQRAQDGCLTWLSVLLEEVYEAAAEEAPDLLKKELVQVAAVALQWCQSIDRRGEVAP